MSDQIFVGRQPILDRERSTFGYELLYRGGPNGGHSFDDPDDATQSVIQRALLDWGMERLIGDRFGFINASPRLVESGIYRALPPEGIIFELREDEPLTDSTVEALFNAKREGYHFAIDNLTPHAELETSSLLPLASVVKVEVSDELDGLPAIVENVREINAGILIVAEKVETMNQYAAALDAGFDLFEGFYFARPELLSRGARPLSSISSLSLLAEMQRQDIEIDSVEELVGTDPSLAYRLLGVVNSSAFGLDRRVESLRHAIVLLGVAQVRRLATVLALSAAGDVSEELIVLGATRARLAGELAPRSDLAGPAFTVGLLSVTDSIYQTPMLELLEELPVSDTIQDALLGGDSELGQILTIVKACESADVEALAHLAPGQLAELSSAYANAVEWADGLRQQMTMRKSSLTLAGSSTLSAAMSNV